MDTMKDTTMQHVTDVSIVLEAAAEFIAVLLEHIEQLESDLATAEQDSRQKQARIARLEQAVQAMTKGYKSVPYAQWPAEMHTANEALEKSK